MFIYVGNVDGGIPFQGLMRFFSHVVEDESTVCPPLYIYIAGVSYSKNTYIYIHIHICV